MAKFKHITFVGFGVMAASMVADLGSQNCLKCKLIFTLRISELLTTSVIFNIFFIEGN